MTRILVEPSDYVLRNVGDMAMMQVAVERLRSLWPTATIEVFSDVPEELAETFPQATPLSSQGRSLWFHRACGAGLVGRLLPVAWGNRLGQAELEFRQRWPKWGYRLALCTLWNRRERAQLRAFWQAVTQADLVVATGMGGITDAFPQYATELLQCLGLAQQAGATTAMMGQGIGPLTQTALVHLARRVLPQLDWIALREERLGKPILFDLNVPRDRIATTGDDAIELAFAQRPQELGMHLGVNVRLASYAEVGTEFADRLRPILHRAAERYVVELRGVPISKVAGEADRESIQRLLGENHAQPMSSVGLRGVQDAATSLTAVIEQLRQCRLVVVGSYHAAVLALSMGIPAVGLAASAYYEGKFLGLSDQFGPGCIPVLLRSSTAWELLPEVIDRAWHAADTLRSSLLAAAEQQIQASYAAYRKVAELTAERERRRRR